MDLIALKTSLVPDTSPAFTSTVVVAGFLVVLLILTILIIIFSLFSKTMSKKQNKKKVEKAIMTEDLKVVSPFAQANSAPAAPAPQSVAAPQVQQGVSEEIVAAISAAVYMMEGENAVITSIKPLRKNPINTRNPWAMAAIVQNTKPF